MSTLYNNLKMFHFNDKLTAIKNKMITAPVHVRLKPTNRCNHRCYYCCYRNDKLYLGQRMKDKDMIPAEKMNEIIKDLISLGVKAVTFSGGGEPLSYPYFYETVQQLTDNGIKIATLTNGSLLKNDIAKILGQTATWVRISIDAYNKELYSKTRGVKLEELDNIYKNIKEFSKIKRAKCEFGISYVINNNNYKDIYNFIKLMKDYGVNHVRFSECVVSTSGNENNEYMRPFYHTVKATLEKAKATLEDEQFKIIDKVHEFEENYDKKYTWCPFIHFLIVIAADLNVYTCQDKAYTDKGLLGSIKDKTLKEFWFSEENKKKIFKLNPSIDCDHHCISHGKNLMLLDYFNVNKDHLEFV